MAARAGCVSLNRPDGSDFKRPLVEQVELVMISMSRWAGTIHGIPDTVLTTDNFRPRRILGSYRTSFDGSGMATKLQLSTYLLGVCLFSICFLVFVNATVSFVLTDIIRQDRGVGDTSGTLGFADELLALVASPLWGLLSDRLGFRLVRDQA